MVVLSTQVLSWMTRGIPISGRPADRPGLIPVTIRSGNHILFHRVCQQVRTGFTGIDIEPGDTVGMVMVEHEPGALLVGIVEGH